MDKFLQPYRFIFSILIILNWALYLWAIEVENPSIVNIVAGKDDAFETAQRDAGRVSLNINFNGEDYLLWFRQDDDLAAFSERIVRELNLCASVTTDHLMYCSLSKYCFI